MHTSREAGCKRARSDDRQTKVIGIAGCYILLLLFSERRAECQTEPEDVPNESLATHTKTLSSTPSKLVDQRALAPPVRLRLLVMSTTGAEQSWRASTTWPESSLGIAHSSICEATARLREITRAVE